VISLPNSVLPVCAATTIEGSGPGGRALLLNGVWLGPPVSPGQLLHTSRRTAIPGEAVACERRTGGARALAADFAEPIQAKKKKSDPGGVNLDLLAGPASEARLVVGDDLISLLWRRRSGGQPGTRARALRPPSMCSPRWPPDQAGMNFPGRLPGPDEGSVRRRPAPRLTATRLFSAYFPRRVGVRVASAR